MNLEYVLDAEGQTRLNEYFEEIGTILANKKRCASFATYALGLMMAGDRKSVEPIAARACGDPEQTDALHQRLLHFLVDSDWSNEAVRICAARYAISAMQEREPIQSWIFDDTGWLKKGKHSVGVQRQYTGSSGKIDNCQIGVSLTVATECEQLPIDFELYLPTSWTEDPARRREARIPDRLTFQTKIKLACTLMERAVKQDIPRGTVLADSFYGNEPAFRNTVRSLGLQYALGIKSNNRVWRVDRWGNRRGKALTVRQLARTLDKESFHRVTWRQGVKRELSAQFAMRRVIPAYRKKSEDPDEREAIWLIIEKPDNEEELKYYFSSFPKEMMKTLIIRRMKERWRTERAYQDLKGQLGLDHYEGRRYPGWHHHVSMVLCCYAFLVAERVRHSPPSATGQENHDAFDFAA